MGKDYNLYRNIGIGFLVLALVLGLGARYVSNKDKINDTEVLMLIN